MTTVQAGLHGALLLARGRADGLRYVDPAPGGAARSFWAMALCLPGFLALRLLDGGAAGPARAGAGHALALALLAYVVGWLAYAVVSWHAAAMLGRRERWPLFVGAWNWCNVVQYLLVVLAAVPRLLGAPELVDQTVGLVAVGWALWLEWYAARLALDVGRLAAAGLVALDLGIGLVLSGVVDALS